MNLNNLAKFTINNVFETSICRTYIEKANMNGWNRTGATDYAPLTRSTTWIDIDTEHLFLQIKPRLPRNLKGRRLLNIPHERVICARYESGDYFSVHEDAPYSPMPERESAFSVIVYLNDDFLGGETLFPDLNETVKPVAGSALILKHKVRHLGHPVQYGTKYILHTFVMYGDL